MMHSAMGAAVKSLIFLLYLMNYTPSNRPLPTESHTLLYLMNYQPSNRPLISPLVVDVIPLECGCCFPVSPLFVPHRFRFRAQAADIWVTCDRHESPVIFTTGIVGHGAAAVIVINGLEEGAKPVPLLVLGAPLQRRNVSLAHETEWLAEKCSNGLVHMCRIEPRATGRCFHDRQVSLYCQYKERKTHLVSRKRCRGAGLHAHFPR